MKNINVLMLGGKRCGKTTVLASMFSEINKALAGTNMYLQVVDQTAVDLNKAQKSIQDKMGDFKTPLTRVEVDDNPTNAQKTYNFKLCIDKKSFPFKIHDIPGEWLVDNHQKEIKSLIRESHVIIIAIDTPYLFSKMTHKGYGIYHEKYNKPLEITNFFKKSLSTNEIQDRMILFVPIKCERYYHLTKCEKLNVHKRNYMQEMVHAVEAGYHELLEYLRSTPGLLNNTTLAITPILSAGGIDFVHFRLDSATGQIVSLYQEPEFIDPQEQGYSPRFCEQPMIYALIYILMQSLQEEKKIFGGGMFAGVGKDKIETSIKTLQKKIKRNTGIYAEDGFYFIQNPKNI